ncbi:alanine racemase [Filibacter tadaridae]|uniref:Alanine racemase n=1 Tax=Filibacter tadaridae TaxID=2483811 RepID=A0A3P5WF90_9BACL|nr:alanine racemase [Filibacter tadaridae]VDC19955.1 Alanine racemase [Filibacter tadaridae]
MENSVFYQPTKAIVNLEAIRTNINSLRNYLALETKIIAVVKADGYGNGEVEVARTALEAGVEMISVATPDEAVRLRRAGISGDILVMGPSPISFAKEAAASGITIAVSNVEWLQNVEDACKDLQKQLKIHVKIDTGMGRIGLRDEEALQSLVTFVNKSKHVVIDGVFTHFACADEENSQRTEEQFALFMKLVDTMPEKPRLVHAANSAAALLYPDFALDAVRFGIALYGIAPSEYVGGRIPLRLERSFSLVSELTYVKRLSSGNRISYGGTYETTEEEWIGTIPIGYADGLRRSLRGQEVLIAGERIPIVGTICMDQCMVRLPREMPIGENVTLIGRQGDEEITMEEWATRLGTIPYEIAVSISKRVPRFFKGISGQPE